MKIFILRAVATIAFLAGVITSLIPIIPTGFIFFLISLSLFLSTSKIARNRFYIFRKRYPKINQKIKIVEDKLPNFLKLSLLKTRPKRKNIESSK